MNISTQQRVSPMMAPYGYCSYPRPESTQISKEDIPERATQLLHNRQLIPEYGVFDRFFEDLRNADLERLLKNVQEKQDEKEPVSLPVREHTDERGEIQQEINSRLPKELTLAEEDFRDSGDEDPLTLLLD